mmetsp:Transcript_54502/g.145413  ORF Transcript_54502/g.145413 Transcript_54502/m.145413 type:complete len:474 (-) Transcript_54502:297-1718(-)
MMFEDCDVPVQPGLPAGSQSRTDDEPLPSEVPEFSEGRPQVPTGRDQAGENLWVDEPLDSPAGVRSGGFQSSLDGLSGTFPDGHFEAKIDARTGLPYGLDLDDYSFLDEFLEDDSPVQKTNHMEMLHSGVMAARSLVSWGIPHVVQGASRLRKEIAESEVASEAKRLTSGQCCLAEEACYKLAKFRKIAHHLHADLQPVQVGDASAAAEEGCAEAAHSSEASCAADGGHAREDQDATLFAAPVDDVAGEARGVDTDDDATSAFAVRLSVAKRVAGARLVEAQSGLQQWQEGLQLGFQAAAATAQENAPQIAEQFVAAGQRVKGHLLAAAHTASVECADLESATWAQRIQDVHAGFQAAAATAQFAQAAAGKRVKELRSANSSVRPTRVTVPLGAADLDREGNAASIQDGCANHARQRRGPRNNQVCRNSNVARGKERGSLPSFSAQGASRNTADSTCGLRNGATIEPSAEVSA